jgi:hypothetical protein
MLFFLLLQAKGGCLNTLHTYHDRQHRNRSFGENEMNLSFSSLISTDVFDQFFIAFSVRFFYKVSLVAFQHGFLLITIETQSIGYSRNMKFIKSLP